MLTSFDSHCKDTNAVSKESLTFLLSCTCAWQYDILHCELLHEQDFASAYIQLKDINFDCVVYLYLQAIYSRVARICQVHS